LIGITHAATGLEDKAREIVEQYPSTEFLLTSIYTRMGDLESALHWIAEAETARTSWSPGLLGWIQGSELIADDSRAQARAAAQGLPVPRTMGFGD
jgi:hypothetical protein